MSEKRQPVPVDAPDVPAAKQSGTKEIDAFIRQAKAIGAIKGRGSGRLILALDATMSRQPTWDMACVLQAEMFDAVGKAGSLNVQLVYFRGLRECRASKFVTDTASLKALMTQIDCRGGYTQIGKVLAHALKETAAEKINALVYIGDAMEEPIDDLAEKAGNLGLRGVPVFIFQEGRDVAPKPPSRRSRGCRRAHGFALTATPPRRSQSSFRPLPSLQPAGIKALEARGRPEDRLMIENMRGGKTG